MRILYLVDCQKDCLDKGGALYVPDAEDIKENIVKLLDEQWDTIIYSLDSHDEEYKYTEEGEIFPPHCIVGTEGHELFEELKIKLDERKNVIPVIELRKNYVNVWAHPENIALLKKLINPEDTVVVAGVFTNYSVLSVIKGLYENINCTIQLKTDCIKGIKDDGYESALKCIEYYLNNKRKNVCGS